MSGKFEAIPMDDSDGLVSYMANHTPRIRSSEVWITPPRVALPIGYLKDAEKIYNMEVRPDDTWVITFPKCGTTWTQEMVWLIGNNCDFDTAHQLNLMDRFPFLDLNSIGVEVRGGVKSFDQANEMKSPRYIKSHLPIELLPHQLWTVKPKIIYTARNPQATALSYYHHYTIYNGYDGDFNSFLDAFLKDQIDYEPYWSHLISFWKLQSEPNVLFLKFEDMKDDLLSEIRKTAKFLGAQLTAEQETKLVEHLTFSSMKNNPRIHRRDHIENIKGKDADKFDFIRKGEKDEWKTVFSEEYKIKFDKWRREKKQDSDFPHY